jgi:hypothetical protein
MKARSIALAVALALAACSVSRVRHGSVDGPHPSVSPLCQCDVRHLRTL